MLSSGAPSCALMPNYVANKQYYRDKVAAASAKGDVAYIVPSQKYVFVDLSVQAMKRRATIW
jgi:hypothetical protein